MDSIRTPPIHVAPTAERKTERGKFENALRGAAQGVARSAGFAAPFVPGGAILAGAVRGAMSQPGSALGPTTGGGRPLSGGVASVAAPSTGPLPIGGGPGDSLGISGDLSSEELIALQLQIQQENREFTTVSNVLKVRHDTAKAAIQNIH
jgi:hypothetical protein